MPGRVIEFEGDEWEVVPGNTGSGIAVGWAETVDITDWLVTFRCLTDPAKEEVSGSVPDKNLNKVSDEVLVRALMRALKRPM